MDIKTRTPDTSRSTPPKHKSLEGVGCCGSFILQEEKAGYRFEKCELCGKKRTIIPPSPPPWPHLNEGGRRCIGIFKFSKSGNIPGARTCRLCSLTETYELSLAVFVARQGISEDALRQFCEEFHENSQLQADDRKVVIFLIKSGQSR